MEAMVPCGDHRRSRFCRKGSAIRVASVMTGALAANTVLVMFLLAGSALLSPSAAAATRPAMATSGANRTVAKKALGIVSGIHGTWSKMPGKIATRLMSPGALIGNGNVGVAIGGAPGRQEFYIGRDDFWSVLRGRVMPVGQLQLIIPALRGASTRLRENIAPADVTATFAKDDARLHTRAWVASNKNVFAVELDNRGSVALPIRARLVDAFGHADFKNLGGIADKVRWLHVSPETVAATIGGSGTDSMTTANVAVRSVQVFPTQSSHSSATKAQKPLYSWSSPTALTGADEPFPCGDIIMPERSFTVRAFVRVKSVRGEGVIFSALVRHRWNKQHIDPANPLGNLRGRDLPRKQGAEAGLLFGVSNGRLFANLNGTVLGASRPLPANRWVTVAVTYDGATLRLLVDGSQVARTTNFPTAAQVMGPQWQWAATHPGDSRIPFHGMAPEGVLALRVVGAQASTTKSVTRFSIPAKSHVIVLVAVMDDRDTPDYFHSALSTLHHASFHTVAAAWSRHLAWWRNFWARSYVEIPDKTIQSWWYGSLYVLASCSRSGNVAPGLWGNWITSPHMAWQGDYTLDYNYEAPFWAAFPTNHVSLADPYDAPLLAWMKRGRGLAKKLHAHGLIYYTHLAPSPGWSADNFRALNQKSDALFAAVNCIQRWRYTHDVAYAKKVWPFLTGVAEFWDHDLKLVKGHYVDFNDAADEHLWGAASDVNPASTLSFLRMLYPALIEMSRQLHTDRQMRSIWSRILSHLSKLPIAPAHSVAAIQTTVGHPIPADQMVILQSKKGMQWVSLNQGDRFSEDPPVKPSGSSAGMNSLQVVFPAWNIGLESSPALKKAAINTIRYMRLWYDNNDTSSFYPAAADVGYNPDSILRHLHLLVTRIGYPNFAYAMPAGGIENEATVPTTIAAMLLQSYQKNIHVFANWPRNKDASFGNLLAVGDFLVSSQISSGKIAFVRITSQRGGICRLANPWGADQFVQVGFSNGESRVMHGAVLSVSTLPGEQLLFKPLPPQRNRGRQ